MNILIHITSDNELIAYEGIALAFTLATFDHHIGLFLSGNCATLLSDPYSRIYGMVQSLDLYDIPKAWHDFDDISIFDDEICICLDDERSNLQDKQAQFDSVLNF